MEYSRPLSITIFHFHTNLWSIKTGFDYSIIIYLYRLFNITLFVLVYLYLNCGIVDEFFKFVLLKLVILKVSSENYVTFYSIHSSII